MTVKLKDIAQASGVSISTVSRILNKDSSRKSSGETAKRVIGIARELGYGAELPARLQALKADSPRQTYSIGCVLTSDHESFVSPFFSTLLAGIQNELTRIGSSLKYKFSVMNFMDPSFPQFIQSTSLDCGIMLGRTSLENINLLKERIPNLVYAGVNSIGADFDEVICDGYAGALLAVKHLIGLGHREIGYIGSTQKKYQVFNEHRYQGYLDAFTAAGLKVDEELVLDTLLTSADGYESMLSLIRKARLPSAVFCGNDTVALGVMRALTENGYSIPGDVSIIGFDDIDMASYVKPTLTTIAVPTKELGRIAVKVMLDKLETGRTYAIKVNLPFKLVERESCRSIAHD
ncbi:MAG: LacI family DNA-binding transcriptional regulator [Spirochaetes bacterium]|nr:LacI family DNA-binding transcriptional regulator [Spirochaetota bacterium]